MAFNKYISALGTEILSIPICTLFNISILITSVIYYRIKNFGKIVQRYIPFNSSYKLNIIIRYKVKIYLI